MKRISKISVKDQLKLLMQYYPESSIVANKSKGFIWEGKLKSSPMGDHYEVKLIYESGRKPEVFVTKPEKLTLPENVTRLRHVYDHDLQKLCLYHPKDKEWHEGKMIASTIIPWAIEWLYHYEIWLITGIWHGGGIEHNSSKKQ